MKPGRPTLVRHTHTDADPTKPLRQHLYNHVVERGSSMFVPIFNLWTTISINIMGIKTMIYIVFHFLLMGEESGMDDNHSICNFSARHVMNHNSTGIFTATSRQLARMFLALECHYLKNLIKQNVT
ncbi:hypothetical protein YC2023_119850 [Brassica napus]